MEPTPGRATPPGDSPGGSSAPEDAGRVTRASRWARGEQARVTHAVEDARGRLEQARPRSPWIDAGFRAIEHDTSSGGAVIAGALAFRVFLFLVPYVFVLVVGVGYAAETFDEDPSSAARDAGIGGLVAKAIGGAADLSGFERLSALVVGAFALFLGARAFVKVLRVAYGMVWNVRPSKLKKTTKPALVAILLTTVGLAFSALVGAARREGLVLAVVGFALSTAVPFGVWLLATWYLPRRTQEWTELVPGAVFFAVGVQVLHLITVTWIAHLLESKTDTYGAIGAALAILLWAYLLGRLMTGACVINASLWIRHHEPAPPADAPQSRSPGAWSPTAPAGPEPEGNP